MTDWYEDRINELKEELGVGSHFEGEGLGCGYCKHEKRAIELGRCERGDAMGHRLCGEVESD